MNAEIQNAVWTMYLVTHRVKMGLCARSQIVPRAVNAQVQRSLWLTSIVITAQVLLARSVKMTLMNVFLSHVKILELVLTLLVPVEMCL